MGHGCCWLCGKNGQGEPLDKHHIFGGALRAKSEKYGLYVYLCHHDCHIFGELSAHRSRETAEALHKWGQKKAMQEQGWTVREFIMEFGKNYLSAAELEAMQQGSVGQATGFVVLTGELPEADFYEYLRGKELLQ